MGFVFDTVFNMSNLQLLASNFWCVNSITVSFDCDSGNQVFEDTVPSGHRPPEGGRLVQRMRGYG